MNPLALVQNLEAPVPSQEAGCSSSTAQAAAAGSGGISNSQIVSRQDPREVPSNSKFNPRPLTS